MLKKKSAYILLTLLSAGLITGFYFFYTSNTPKTEFISPLAQEVRELATPFGGEKYETELSEENILNILLLGIDRRNKFEAFRTDIMILVSINKDTNRVLLTSIPRDLWFDGGRINALYPASGWISMQNAITTITGQKPQRFILTDFEDFTWIVDAVGGVPVEVETTFTDTQYPVDATFEYQTVTFNKGFEKMTGERALIFSRSRKGDFDNGDWGRMKRQHLLLKGFLAAAVQPESMLCKNSNKMQQNCESNINAEILQNAFKTVTTSRMDTNIKPEDLVYLWDLYKDRKLYTIDSLLMDHEFVYTPPMEQYGGAWVLIPNGNDYTTFQQKITQMLSGTPSDETQPINPNLQNAELQASPEL